MYCTDLQQLFDLVFADELVKGHGRLSREMRISLFFPNALWEKYAGKSKSNLSWFLRGDSQNMAMSNTLHQLFTQNPYSVIREMEDKCRAALWHGAVPRFQAEDLRALIRGICAETQCLKPYREKAACFPPEKALSRLMLSLAFYPPARSSMRSQTEEERKAQSSDLQIIWTQISDEYTLLDEQAASMMEKASFAEQYRYGSMLCSERRYQEAFAQFTQAIEKVLQSGRRRTEDEDDPQREFTIRGHASSAEEAALFCRTGLMLFSGEGAASSDPKLAFEYIRYACCESYPQAHFELSRLLREGHGCARDEAKAFEHLTRAAQQDILSAVRDLGALYYTGSAACPRDEKQAQTWFERGAALDKAHPDGAFCQYMLGRILEDQGDKTGAMRCYELAADAGSTEAADKRWSLDASIVRDVLGMQISPPSSDRSRLFFFSAVEGGNRVLWDSLPPHAPDAAAAYASPREMVADLRLRFDSELHAAFSGEGAQAPQLIFAFLSSDQEANLEFAAAALQLLTECAQALGEPACWRLAENTRLYIQGSHSFAGMILDSAYAGLGRLYFPIHLIDPDRTAAQQLLAQRPLFIPLLQEKESRTINLIILGTSECAMHIAREAAALYMTGYPVRITVLGPDADRLHSRMQELCPGLYAADRAADFAIPQFYPCDLAGGGLGALLRLPAPAQDTEDTDALIAQRVRQGNYFVVATQDDAFNFEFAVRLRSTLLKLTPSYTNRPPVSVLMRSHNVASSLSRRLSASGRGTGGWWNQYDLHCFGTGMQLYAWQQLNDDILERRALAAHLMYWNVAPGDELTRRAALSSYYSRQYNRDSSRALALYLPYRLFDAGLSLDDERQYAGSRELMQLGRAYTEDLGTSPERMSSAIRAEHERWCAWLITQGWERASVMEVEAFVRMGNPSHQLHIAK